MEEGLSGFYIKTASVRGAGGGGVVGLNGGGGTGAKCGRWNPTTEQVKVLTELFRSGLRTPSTDQIQKISTQLSLYGKIESKNVFYWFQNHKARERQKRRKVSNASDQRDFLRKDDKVFSPNHFAEIKQVSEPDRVMETLQLFPINAMEEAAPVHRKLRSPAHAKQCKDTASFTYTIETEMGTHPPLDLRLSFL